jgi:hypothetical protein
MGEIREFGRSWSCRGGGLAVSLLLITVVCFRQPRDLIFWAALAFFAVHTAMTVWRYLRERRARTSATVIRHHDSLPVLPVVFLPNPVHSLISLKTPTQQTKNAS